MMISPVSYSPNFNGNLDKATQKLFSRKIKNVNLANLNLGKKSTNSISVSYNMKPKGQMVTTMYVNDTSSFTNPYVSVELGEGKMPFDSNLLNLIKKNILKAEEIQKKFIK